LANHSVYIDPSIDLTSHATIEIIIQFRSRFLHNHTNAEKEERIKESKKRHGAITDAIQTRLIESDIPYTIQHIYKNAFYGLSMKICAIHINHLLTFMEIEAIYLNKEMKIPTQPSDPSYQL